MDQQQRQHYLLTSHDPYAQQPVQQYASHHDIAERAVYVAGSFLTALLGLRFAFALLGANPENGFASFVYGFTAPFVAPFYNLFSYDHAQLGVAIFQGYTLVAMLVYSLLVTGIARLITITRR